MGGLEEIINQIQADANAEAEKIMQDANEKCNSIMQDNADTIKEIQKEGQKIAQKESELVFLKLKSAAEMEEKKEILHTKQEIIADIIEKAYNQICNLPNEEYFNVLLNIACEYAQKRDGVICMNEKDLSNLPNDFETRVNENMQQKGGTLKIQKTPIDIENGIILDYGDIEENCTFKSLVNNKKEYLQDSINNFLFK